MSKLDNIFGRTFGQRVFGLGPHKLIGIELRGNRLEIDAHRAVCVKVTQEADALQPSNIGVVETDVAALPSGRQLRSELWAHQR